MRISVTVADVDSAHGSHHSRLCPVAQSLMRTTGSECVTVSPGCIVMAVDAGLRRYRPSLTLSAAIIAYRKGKPFRVGDYELRDY